jgi:replicative DNA helicase
MVDMPERVPPQNIEAEQSVLGSMLLEKEAVNTAVEHLQSQDFYREAHRRVFQAMLDLTDKGEPLDVITLVESLRQRKSLEEIGGITYLTHLANVVPTAANVAYYTRIVREKSLMRQLISAATKIVTRGYESRDDVEQIIDEAEQAIFSVAQSRAQESFVPLKTVLMDTFDHIALLYENKGGLTGVSTGFPDLDNLTSGLQPSDLIIIAARPSMGKTTLALNIAQHIGIKEKKPVAVFSLEMSREQLVQRMLCAQANIDAHRLRRGFLADNDWNKLTEAVGPLGDAPIFIDDSPSISVMEMRAKARRLKMEHGLGAIFVDYLQLMRGSERTENRQQEISAISRGLKALAKELDLPVVALSQLSREVEKRHDKHPILSDLLESGGIEANADLVAFIYRDEYYNPESEKKGIAEVIIAKQRNGPTGKLDLFFMDKFNKFMSTAKGRTAEEEAS